MKSQVAAIAKTGSEQAVKKVLEEVNQRAVVAIERLANEWMSESKIIHAGAALALAQRLKQTIEGK